MSDELKLVSLYEKSLFDDNIKSTLENFLEIGIDSVMNDGLLRDIPIVSTLVSFGKAAANIYDRNLLKQTLVFLKAFNSQTIEKEKLNSYREALQGNPKKAEAELGRVIILLNSYIDDIKSRILAKLFSAYINSNISWKQFCELSDVVTRIFISDIDILLKIKNDPDFAIRENSYHIDRLIALGLLRKSIKSILAIDSKQSFPSFNDAEKARSIGNRESIIMSELGVNLCTFGLSVDKI